jgi:hypothetical protein
MNVIGNGGTVMLRTLTITLSCSCGLVACATDPNAKLSLEQVCQHHFDNDDAEREKCALPPELRKGATPQSRPEDLPIRSRDGNG